MADMFKGVFKNRYDKEMRNRGLDGSFIFGMILAGIAVFILWWTPFLFPFRIYTTAVHEVSHAIAATVFGQGAGIIELYWNGGGITTVRVDSTFSAIMTYSAGYLGSVIFGGILLLMAKNPTNRRRVLWFISIALVIITVFYIRDIQSLLLVGIVLALTGLVAWRGPDIVVTFSLFTMALLNCLYSIFDLLNVFFATTNPFHRGFNDAIGLERYTGIPALVWSLAWAILGAFMMFMFVKRAIVHSPAMSAPRPGTAAAATGKSPFDAYDKYLDKK